MKYALSYIVIALIFVSCAKKRAEKQATEDETIITNYIAAEDLTATRTSTGLYYVIDEPGIGESCVDTSTVVVAYKGYLTNGSIFDQSLVSGIEINLQSTIQGWTEGIPFYNEGGIGKLLIPSALGYGNNTVGSIPANSVLVFDIELIDVVY